MPNANPSGKNQPLNQHPLPLNELYTMAEDAAYFSGLDVASGDVRIVPPPVSGGRRQVPGLCLNALGGVGTDDATVQLIYKDGNGNEVILEEVDLAAGLAGDFAADIFLVPSDLGLFLRVTVDAPGDTVSLAAAWRDVRNVERYDIALTDAFQSINPSSPLGNTAFIPTADMVGDVSGAKIFNYDSIDHDFEVQLTDGSTVFGPIAVGTVLAGKTGLIPPLCLPLPPGFFFQARISLGAITDDAPVFSMPLSLINQGPARQEQGGGY